MTRFFEASETSQHTMARFSTMDEAFKPTSTFWIDQHNDIEETFERAEAKIGKNLVAWIDFFVQDIKRIKTIEEVAAKCACQSLREVIIEDCSRPSLAADKSLVLTDIDTNRNPLYETMAEIRTKGVSPFTKEWLDSYHDVPANPLKIKIHPFVSPTTTELLTLPLQMRLEASA